MTFVQAIPLIAAGIGAASASKTQRSLQRERAKERAILEKSQKKFEERIAEYEKSEFKPLDIEALKQENVFEDVASSGVPLLPCQPGAGQVPRKGPRAAFR